MSQDSRVFVAGNSTLIGAAIERQLQLRGQHIVGATDDSPNLLDPIDVDEFLKRERPDEIYLVAGKSGGISYNAEHPAELMLDNLKVQTNVIEAAHRNGITRLLYLASSCSYPKHCTQPMQVESLMTGPLEPTNEPYALAKLSGLTLCQAHSKQYGVRYLQGIPGNAFGREDDFSPEGGHVIPALIGRMHEAREASTPSIEIWGTGTPRREFVYADDLADACIFTMKNYDDPLTPINLGCGDDLSIAEVAEAIQVAVGYEGQLRYDTSKPDGMPLKSLDSSKLLELGWQPKTPFAVALAETYESYLHRETTRRSPLNV